MKRSSLLLLLVILPFCVNADVLSDILTNKYAAKTLSAAQMDSILGRGAADESARYRLQHRDRQKMYRHSFWANYFLRDTKRNEDVLMCDTLTRDAQMSPNGKYVVYGKGQDLYIYKVDFKTEIAITTDYKRGADVFSGLSDWLYEEEFGITCLFEFSPDSRQVAFVRLDETDVPVFSWQTYLVPKQAPQDNAWKYPVLNSLRYPKSGDNNAKASVCIYDIATKGILTMNLPEQQDRYIPRLRWREMPGKQDTYELIVETVNRDQNRMEVYACNPKSAVCYLLYKEYSDRYFVDYALFDEWQWLSDGRIVVLSEKNDWRQLYLYSAQGLEQKVLTPSGMDVTAVYGCDEANGVVYYEAAPVPSERQAYAVALKKGTVSRLTTEPGTHSLTFSDDMHRCIDCFQSETVPNRYSLYNVKGTKWTLDRVVKDNWDVMQQWQALNLPAKQFLRIPTERGDTLEAWMIMPQIEAGKRYPVVLMQYSGPASQRVLNRWRHRFGHYLASQGYIVINADPRGTDCRGRQWRNGTYLLLGQKEAEDHLSVARYMQSLPYADANRIAMIGWSYGGYQTIRTLCDAGNDMADGTPLIKCGIAVAPVTDWRLYDTGYTERYMQRPQVNESGYKASDLTAMAANLRGNLLLVHGTADDNVHVQNSYLLMDALIAAGKQFDMQLYIDDNHSMRRAANSDHLHRRMMRFLQTNL